MLVVNEKPAATVDGAGGPTGKENMEELFEVEFLEESSGRLSDVTAAAAAVADEVPETPERELNEAVPEVRGSYSE